MHWLTYGQREGRTCNPSQLYPQYQHSIALLIPGTEKLKTYLIARYYLT
jgi:hypothetical protein